MPSFKTLSRYVFAILFVGGGFLHFAIPDFYLKIMPDYFPVDWRLPLVNVSGVAEIVLGALLMFRDFQRVAAWGLILLLIAVFPANIYAYQHRQELAPQIPGIVHLARLPAQGLLILWAYWYTRPPRRAQGRIEPAAPPAGNPQ